MKSPSLDHFYHKIDKKISLLEAYTEIKELSFIVKSCRLKPHSYFFEEKDNKIILHKKWFDEFGNSINFGDKKIQIIYNDLSLEREQIVCTDLYFNLKISKVLKMSKVLYISIGKDEDTYQDSCMLGFLGLDNYWRNYLYFYGEWSQVSPLLMKFENLKLLAQKRDIKYFIELNNKNMPLPCFTSKQWLASLPLDEKLLNILKRDHDFLLPILYEKDTPKND